MMPPECEICGKRFGPSENSGLIYFKQTLADKAWYVRANASPGFTGHPPNAVWFCEDHYPAAKQLEHLNRREAMEKLRASD